MNRGEWFPIGAAVALIIAACGGGAAATPTTAPATPAATSTPTPSGAPRPTPTAAPQPTATPAPAATPTPPPEKQPKYGGIITLATASNRFEWDLLRARTLDSHAVIQPMMNGLIQRNPFDERQIVPDLATEWEISKDAKSYTFRLRKDVKWHDGAPLVASDVVASFYRAFQPGFVSFMGIALEPILDISTPDDYTVVFLLKRPKVPFLSDMADLHTVIYPVRRVSMDKYVERPIGTGPFKFKSWIANVESILERNPAFYRKDASGGPLPYLDGIRVVVTTDSALNYANFLAGRTDLAGGTRIGIPRGKDVELVQKVPGASVRPLYGGPQSHIVFNQVAPWTDLRVRQALNVAIDRKELFTLAKDGRGSMYGWGLQPPQLQGQWGRPESEFKGKLAWDGTEEARLAEARRLLSEAGLRPSDLNTKYLCSNQTPADCEVFVGQMKKLGVTMSLDMKPLMADVWAEVRKGNFTFFQGIWSMQWDDPQYAFADLYLTERDGVPLGNLNGGKWRSPRLEELYDRQNAELDQAKRRALAQEFDTEVERLLWVIVYHHSGGPPGGAFWQPWVKGVPLLAIGQWSNVHRQETAWLDK